jgi:hypothetical protein
LAQRILRRFPQGNDPFFVPLAAHQHVAELELEIFQFDSDDF